MLVVDKHCTDVCCDEFSCHKLIAKVNNPKNSDMKNFICNQYGERHPIFKHQKYQNLWTNNKVRGECKMLAFSSTSAEYLQKFEFLISQGIVATCLGWGGRCHMGFVANFIRFRAVQKFWESVKFWQIYREFKGENFFETQCRSSCYRGYSKTVWSPC